MDLIFIIYVFYVYIGLICKNYNVKSVRFFFFLNIDLCVFFLNSLIVQNFIVVVLCVFEFLICKKCMLYNCLFKKNRVVLYFILSLIFIVEKKIFVNIRFNMYKYCLIYYYMFLINGNLGLYVFFFIGVLY